MKTMIGVGALLLVALVAGRAFAQGAAAAAGPPGTDTAQDGAAAQQRAEADALIKRGTARLKAGDELGAYDDFTRAHALRKAWKSGGNGGHVACKLNKFAESVALFRDGLSLMPPDYKDYDSVQAKFKRRMAECAAQAGALRFSIQPAGAQLLVDGKAVGTAPLAEPVYVDAGTHRVEVRLAGHETATLTVEARAGSETTVALTLTEASAAAGPDAGAADGGVSGLGIAGVVVGGVGMIVGVGLMIAAAGELSDAEALQTQILSSVYAGDTDPCGAGFVEDRCAALNEAGDASSTFTAVGITMLVAGGVVTAAGVVVLLLDGSGAEGNAEEADGEGRDEVSWRVQPLLAPGEVGLSVGGRF